MRLYVTATILQRYWLQYDPEELSIFAWDQILTLENFQFWLAMQVWPSFLLWAKMELHSKIWVISKRKKF